MAAGLGFKTFTTGEVLTAADTNGYLMQGVLVFASAAARDAAITSPQEGQFAYLKDTNVTTYYTGSAWANLDTTGMTNPMTTTGDTIYSSSGSTPARLGIGSTGQVLTVAGGIPSWATASSNSGLVFVGSTSFSASSTVNLDSVFSSTYNNYKIVLSATASVNGVSIGMRMRTGGTTNSSAQYNQFQMIGAAGNYYSTASSAGNTSWSEIAYCSSTMPRVSLMFEIFNPFETTNTAALGTFPKVFSGAPEFQNIALGMSVTTSYDGFSLIPASGNITGTVAVYGMRNS